MRSNTDTRRGGALLRMAAVAAVGCGLLLPSAAVASATPSPEATCVGLASAYFTGVQSRDDVAHAIAERFGIPPGAEVSRFAHVRLGDTEACIANGQSGG
jgi:hypothetical protein